MGAHLNNLHRAFSEVFFRPSYIALAGALALLAVLFAVWLPNIGLITDIFTASSAPLAAKFGVLMSLLLGISTNFSVLSAGYTIAIAILFGLNIALTVYFLNRQRTLPAKKELAAGFGGIASGALGVGCAACGSLILTTAFSLFGAADVLALLPLRGGELGVVSVLLLLTSLLLMSKKIAVPLTCKSS